MGRCFLQFVFCAIIVGWSRPTIARAEYSTRGTPASPRTAFVWSTAAASTSQGNSLPASWTVSQPVPSSNPIVHSIQDLFEFAEDLVSLGGFLLQSPRHRKTFNLSRRRASTVETTSFLNGSDKDARKEENDCNVFSILSSTKVVDPKTGRLIPAIDDFGGISSPFFGFGGLTLPPLFSNKKVLVVIMPQLGDFDSAEYAELLQKVLPDLKKKNIDLRIVGIGSTRSAILFSRHTGIPLDNIRVDPTASVHKKLNLHRGPNWDVPNWIPNNFVDWFAKEVCGCTSPKIESKDVARSWMNYMAMCAGIASPGTINEILRGYVGDKSAPERLTPSDKIVAGPIAIKGVTDVKLGPIKYKSLWKDQKGFLRPAELATVRLRTMVEVLTKFDHYVPDQRLLDWRGATFLLDASITQGGKPLYEYRDRGVLTYSETPARPLEFLSSFIGSERARNPVGLRDPDFVYED